MKIDWAMVFLITVFLGASFMLFESTINVLERNEFGREFCFSKDLEYKSSWNKGGDWGITCEQIIDNEIIQERQFVVAKE